MEFDAIDRLFLQARKIKITAHPALDEVQVELSGIADTEPIDRVSSAPGFSLNVIRCSHWISVPSGFSCVEVGKAIAATYAGKGYGVELYADTYSEKGAYQGTFPVNF